MSEIPEDIDWTATKIVRAEGGDDWDLYLAIAKALMAERERGQTVAAQAYQVIGNLLDWLGEFESPEGIRALDYFSSGVANEDFLPWPARGRDLHDSDYVPRRTDP